MACGGFTEQKWQKSDFFVNFFWFLGQKIRYSPGNSGLSSYPKEFMRTVGLSKGNYSGQPAEQITPESVE